MTKIGLLSDTHSVLLPEIIDFLQASNQIWHAGDWGSLNVLNQLKLISPIVRGVYGNIDGCNFHPEMPENLLFDCENTKVLITHIGGYPGKYESKIRKLLALHHPQLFIAGHSHILKVIFDQKYQVLHLNPGAAGISGFHNHITAMRFFVHDNRIEQLEVFDLERNKIKRVE